MPGEWGSTPRDIQRYLGRISGPLLDRIDLHVEVPAVKFCEITSERTDETSAQIRERVIAARRRPAADGRGDLLALAWGRPKRRGDRPPPSGGRCAGIQRPVVVAVAAWALALQGEPAQGILNRDDHS